MPLYLSELISHYLPHRSLHSSNTNLLTRPAGITSNFSSRAFSVSAPSTWNSLPAHIRSIDPPLNAISSSLPLPSSHPVPAPQIRSHDFWRYINLYVCMYVRQTSTQVDHGSIINWTFSQNTVLKEFVHFSMSHQRTMQGKHTDFMPLTRKH